MTARASLAAALATLAFAAPAGAGSPELAAEPVQALPCRPTIACTAEIVPAGALEVETGFAQRRAGGSASSVLALLKYSVTDWLQLQLGTNNLVVADGGDARWMDGAYIGPKLVLIEQTERVPAVAVSALFMLPTRDGAEAATRTTDGYFWGYASKDLRGFHADLNLGVDVLSIDRAPATQLLAALSVSHDIAHGAGAMLEAYAFERGAPYAVHDAGVLMGLSYAPVPRVVFDLGADIALHRDARDATLFAGVTFIPYAGARPRPAHPELAATRK